MGPRAQLRGQSLATVMKHVAEGDLRTGLEQRAREALTQAAGGTCDQNASTIQTDFRGPSRVWRAGTWISSRHHLFY